MYTPQYKTSIQDAKESARTLFKKYCYSGSELTHYQVSSMVRDLYATINKNYTPNTQQIKGYQKNLDFNSDGKVTIEDLQAKAIKYLCGQQPFLSTSFANTQPQRNTYTQQVKRIMFAAKGIFERYQSVGLIGYQQIFYVLGQTYELLGRKGYRPSQEDVRVWIKLCDGNSDGKVNFEEYSEFVQRSLERSGYKIYVQ